MKLKRRTDKERADYLQGKVTDLMMELQDRNMKLSVIEDELVTLETTAREGNEAITDNCNLQEIIEHMKGKIDRLEKTGPKDQSLPNQFEGKGKTCFKFNPDGSGHVTIDNSMMMGPEQGGRFEVPLEDILAFVGFLVQQQNIRDL